MSLTTLSAQDLEDLLLLVPRILADYRSGSRGPLQMLYVFSNTTYNEDSTFLRAIQLAEAGLTRNLGIVEGDRGFGYEGFEHSVQRLRALGWRDFVPIEKFDVNGNVHTGSEAEILTQYAVRHPGDIGIIATPFHLVRAFITTVSRTAAAQTRVYAYASYMQPWLEHVRHSQGTVNGTRADLLEGELRRLEKYRAPEYGSMLTARRVLEYLNWRDS